MIFNGTNSRVQNTTYNLQNVDKYSVMVFFKADSAGETSNGRLFCAPEDTPALQCRMTSTTNIRIRRDRATNDGTWDVACVLNKWHCLAFSHDAGNTAADPIAYMRVFDVDGALKPVTVTQALAPSGALTGLGTGYAIGNKTDQGETFDGSICFVQFWNRLLTIQEFQQAMLQPGIIRKDLVVNQWLMNDFRDRSRFGGNASAIGMAVGGLPPGIMPFMPKSQSLLYQGKAASAITSKPYYFNNFILSRRMA